MKIYIWRVTIPHKIVHVHSASCTQMLSSRKLKIEGENLHKGRRYKHIQSIPIYTAMGKYYFHTILQQYLQTLHMHGRARARARTHAHTHTHTHTYTNTHTINIIITTTASIKHHN